MIELVKEQFSKLGTKIIIRVSNERYDKTQITINLIARNGDIIPVFSEIPELDSIDTECLAYLIGKNSRAMLGFPLTFH